MIPAERFLVQSEYRDEWLAARSTRVTATEVAEAATPAGFKTAVAKRVVGAQVEVNPMMQFGTDSEHELAMWGKEQFGVLPNSWLIEGENPAHAATPDGLTLDHVGISECKTTGTDWGLKPPLKYLRQMWWQLHVTGAQWCELIWNLRVTVNEVYQLGWFEPKHLRVYRDEEEIGKLIQVATRLQDELEEAA